MSTSKFNDSDQTLEFSDETVNQLLAEKLNDQLTLVVESSPRKIYLDFKIWPNGGLGLWFSSQV